jgi:hypothetical protein
MDRYLFVMTRDIISHPSAVHILRIALGLQRRSERVTIFLTDDAARVLPRAESGPALRPLLAAGATVLAEGDVPDHLSDAVGFERAEPDALAALLTSPGVQAHWC